MRCSVLPARLDYVPVLVLLPLLTSIHHPRISQSMIVFVKKKNRTRFESSSPAFDSETQILTSSWHVAEEVDDLDEVLNESILDSIMGKRRAAEAVSKKKRKRMHGDDDDESDDAV